MPRLHYPHFLFIKLGSEPLGLFPPLAIVLGIVVVAVVCFFLKTLKVRNPACEGVAARDAGLFILSC